MSYGNNDKYDEYGNNGNNGNNDNKPRISYIGYTQIKQVPKEELEIGKEYYFFFEGNFYLGKLLEILKDNPRILQTSYLFTATKKYETNTENSEDVKISNSKLVETTMSLPFFVENTIEGGRRKTLKHKLNKRKTKKIKRRKAKKTYKKSSSK